MYVVIDVVCNHMGTLLTSTAPGYPAYNYPTGYPLSWRDTNNKYRASSDPSKFHNYGDVSNWSGAEQVLGAIFGLNDIKTEDASVQAELVHAYTQPIADTDCDGYRVDTVKHVDGAFWDAWCPGITSGPRCRARATSSCSARCSTVTPSPAPSPAPWAARRTGSTRCSGTACTGRRTTSGAANAAPQDIVNTYTSRSVFDPTVQDRLVTFLDNHDNARFQAAGVANQDQSRARAALAWLLTSDAIPASTTAPSRSSTAAAIRGAARTCGTGSGTSVRRSATTSRSRTRCSAGRAR